MPVNPLHLLLNPRSIATAGASNNPMKMGTLQALSILKDGWQGAFYPIHPTEKTVLGHKAYVSPRDLPETPDLALLVVPTALVVPLLEAFAAIGTKRAIVISAGFKETGDDGRLLEERLKEIVAQSGMRLLGPNCMGIINTAISLNVTVAPLEKRPGLLGLASQSGTYVTQTLAYLKERGIRFSKAISCGNEADIDIVDALEYLGEDEQTKAIILYIEGIRDGRRFIETARRITPVKPVLAQYVGGSAAGARAGLSHTGALAGPDLLYDGILRQAGIIRCHSIEELYAHGWVHATQPPLRGKRLAVVTNSGGPGTAISHTADQGGMTLPRFSDALQARIRPLIPPHAAGANPVDLTFHLDMDVLTKTIPEFIMESKRSGRHLPPRRDEFRVHGDALPPRERPAGRHLPREFPGNDGDRHGRRRGSAPEIWPPPGRFLLLRQRRQFHGSLSCKRRPGLRLSGEGGPGNGHAPPAQGGTRAEAHGNAAPPREKPRCRAADR